MCLAIPAKVIEILNDEYVMVDLGGTQKKISTVLLEHIQLNDYVIIHVGYALSRMDEQCAKETLRLIAQLPEGK